MTKIEREVADPIIAQVVDKQISRSSYGFIKYGTLLTRSDLTVHDWLNHAQEEAMDFVNYLQVIKNQVALLDEGRQLPLQIPFMSNFEMVQEFRRIFEHDGVPWLWVTLILEEFKELLEAWGYYAEMTVAPIAGKDNDDKTPNDKVGTLDAICDLLYVTYGLGSALGWNVDAAFKEVHRSNMTKLGEDGKPIKREDGKIMKSSKYEAPQLEQFIGEARNAHLNKKD